MVDTAVVHQELERLWAQLNARRTAAAGPGGLAAQTVDGVLVRSTTLNLIAVAAADRDAGRIEATVGRLTEFCPSRALILVTAPPVPPEPTPAANVPAPVQAPAPNEAPPDAPPAPGSGPAPSAPPPDQGLKVRVAVHEQSLGKGRPAVRFESVTVNGGAAGDASLASIATPLLVPELPDFLWWPGHGFAGSVLFQELAATSDRVMVDTAALKDPAPALRALHAVIRRGRATPKVSDFAWSRLAPWRQLAAQFFDQPATLPCLHCLDEVDIGYSENPVLGRSGMTAGLLAAGWFATRLGWTAPGELVRSRTGWRVTLRAGRPGQRREVILTLRPVENGSRTPSLAEVRLVATGDAPGVFSVARVDDNRLTTTSEIGTMPPVSRMVYVRDEDDPDLLESELRMFGRDRVYEEALAFASALLPDQVPS